MPRPLRTLEDADYASGEKIKKWLRTEDQRRPDRRGRAALGTYPTIPDLLGSL